tara:strand:- start:2288 stop:2962 length:675 start_codon:yes stop_codon:yes gene_type:complete
MLKPTKKITKKEIQRDPFLESVDKAQAHLQEQRSMYMKIAIGLIAVLIGYNVISEKQTQQDTEANSLLGQAMVALDRGDESNAQFQLETIITEYNGTHSAEVAGYHLGKMKYEAGDFTSAEIYLSQFIRDNAVDLMMSSAAYMLADIAVQDGDTNSALSFLDKGVQKSTDVHTSRMMELEKAKLILAQGDLEGARTIATDILAEKNVTSIQKQTAEEILGKIPG